MAMHTIPLGKSSLSASRLGYGCWRIAGTWNPSAVTPEKEATGRAAVAAAFEAGYTLFDLADIYCDGHCERIFGQVLQSIPEMRRRVLVVTKCGIRMKGQPQPNAPYRYDFSREHILESCQQSLRRLGIETIDLYLLHRPDYLCDPHEVAEAFSSLKADGKVREFGVSNFRPAQLGALQKACPMPLVVHQIELSLAHLDALHDGTLDQCLAESITPQAWSPVGGGRLASADPPDLQSPDHAHRIHLREIMDAVARQHGVTREIIALAWLLLHPARVHPIIGTTNPARIRDLARADETCLTREEWYQLLEAALGERLP